MTKRTPVLNCPKYAGSNPTLFKSHGGRVLAASSLPHSQQVMKARLFVTSLQVCLLYLALRKDSEITYVHPDFEEGGEMLQSNNIGDDDLGGRFGPLPREDIAHMQLGSPRARDGLLSEPEGSEVLPLDREGYRRKHGLILDQVGPE
jgi:hypothetical protein